MKDEVKVTVIATGFNRDDIRADHRPMASSRRNERHPMPEPMDAVVAAPHRTGLFSPRKDRRGRIGTRGSGITAELR